MGLKMKCEKNVLFDAVNIVLKAVPQKTTMDILNCILITANEGEFKLLSNDMEMSIETKSVSADVETPGGVAVDAKLFGEFLKSLPDGEVSLVCSDNNLVKIKSGKTEFKLMGQNEDIFPKAEEFDTNSQLTIESKVLKDMIRKTIFSVSADTSRPIFTGELFKVEKKVFTVVSADIYRISQVSVPVEMDAKESFIIPAKTLGELMKIIPEESEEIKVFLSDNLVSFETSKFNMVSRLIAGDFIDYKRVFPKEANTEIKINRNDILRSLERASILAKEDKKNPVKLEITSDNISITSNTGISDFYEEISIESKGDDVTIGFNPRYIIEALRAIDEEEVTMEFTSPLSPCVITGDKDSKYMVLPLKLKNI